MGKNTTYYRIINGTKWGKLSKAYREAHPYCEKCLERGIYTPVSGVHHIRPIGSARSMEEARQLAFDETNLMALCTPCHSQMHKQLNSHTREEILKRKDNRAQMAFEELFNHSDQTPEN